jgi:hypothetical protein
VPRSRPLLLAGLESSSSEESLRIHYGGLVSTPNVHFVSTYAFPVVVSSWARVIAPIDGAGGSDAT